MKTTNTSGIPSINSLVKAGSGYCLYFFYHLKY